MADSAYYNKVVVNGVPFSIEKVIPGVSISGNGDPSEDINANVGQLYADISSPSTGIPIWVCTAKKVNGKSLWQKTLGVVSGSDITTIVASIN